MQSTPNSVIYNYGLLRHGETIWNSEKRVQGHGDSPLTKAGEDQLQHWAEYLQQGNWQRILCSDLGRVQQTVAIINARLNLPVTIDTSLREQNWGLWEGMRVEDVKREYAEELAVQVKKGWEFCPPQGESRQEVRERVFAALDSSRQTFKEYNILVVCHLGVIKTVIYSIAGRQFMEDEPKLLEKNCMHEIAFHTERYHTTRLNISSDT